MQITADSLIGKVKYILIGLFVIFVWVTFVDKLLDAITGIPRVNVFYPITTSTLFFSCLIAPIYVPITIVRIMDERLLTPIVILSSIIFGWAHGFGAVSLMYQGVMGIVFSYVYIKNGNCYWSSVVLHSLWNFCCITYLV
jgi:membrane protease YdiL (CAAX protease family)